ncbi:formimidoylglutamase [Halobacteriales archaeon SW_7_68_16]|nr:MAG: formimidoylglutamase [Halobacteriales archaeon SW_7_68_16]
MVSPATDPVDETIADVTTPTDPAAAGDHDAVLVGEPFDAAVIGRPGAREGPAAIRTALAGTGTHHFDAGPITDLGDLGSVVAPDDDPATIQGAVRAALGRVHDADTLPLVLGGDNSLTAGNVAPLLDGSVGVVNLDAHLDCREVRAGPTSGTPYRQLLEAGLDGYAVVGARHFETSTVYHDYCRARGGAILTPDEVRDDPVAAADRALDALGDVDRVYVSLDCDVVDAAAAPGVSAPTPGGLATADCFRLLRVLASDDRLAGFEVVECAPPLDTRARTATVAARALAHVLAVAT